MEDIIVDEPAPTSIRSRTQKRFRRSRPRRDLTVYLFDWLVKGMVVALLLSINFLLFASAGNFTVFSSGFSMSYETFFVLAAIFGVSLALMFLISFSSFLQNVVTAAAVGFFVYISLNQFALFDKFSFLAYMTAPYLGNETAMNFMTNSDIVASGAAAVLSFIFLAMSDKKNIAYFTGILIVVFAGILADEYFNRENHNEFKTVYDNSFSKAERGKKFIYIMLPNAASVSYLEDMKEANADAKKVENVQNIMLGFFAKNDFTLYPNAFVTADDPFKNMIRSFNNLSKDKEDSFIASTVSMDGYWSFKNINDEYIYLNENQLFDVFRKARYKISAYKSRGMDMCGKNGVRNADRCVEKVNSPISFDDMKLSALERTKLLVIQWLESMGVFNNMEPLYTALKAVTRPDNLPMVGQKFDNLYVVDAPKTLETAGKDIVKDRGNQAYFIMADMPSDMFVYNEFCQIKPISQWLDMESLPWIINKNLYNKRTAYLDQTACLFGKLEQFMDYLKKSGVLDKSVVVIQGLSGADDLKNVTERQFIPDFKNKKLVTMAIRDPLKKQFAVGEEVCMAADILNQYLFKREKCSEMNGLELHSGAKKELKGMLGRYKIMQKAAQDAIRHFTDWHKLWNKVNKMPKGSIGIVPLPTPEEQAEKALDELDASREPDEISAGQPPERSIGEAPVMQAPVSENPEDDVESLQEKMIESDMTSAGDGSDIAAPFGKTISEDDEKAEPEKG